MKKYIHLLGISVTICMLVIVIIALINKHPNITHPLSTNQTDNYITSGKEDIRTKYVISPNVCKGIFSYFPKDFFEHEFVYYDQIGDLRSQAKIDINNNLILELTEKQKEDLINIYLGGLDYIIDSEWLTVNKDYSGFTINAYSDNINNCIWQLPITIFHGMMLKQMIDGRPMDDISVEVVVRDAGTEKVIYSATYPQEEVKLDFDKSQFSTRE